MAECGEASGDGEKERQLKTRRVSIRDAGFTPDASGVGCVPVWVLRHR